MSEFTDWRQIQLTYVQRGLLGFLRNRPGVTFGEIVEATSPDDSTLREALDFLVLNGLAARNGEGPVYTYAPTDHGLAKVGARPGTWVNTATCGSCVQAFCVCRHRIECIAVGQVHSLGCHGSHD